MGDLSPAPTILPTPLPAPIAVSNVTFWVGVAVGARFELLEMVSGPTALPDRGLGGDFPFTESKFRGSSPDRGCMVDSDTVGSDDAGALGVRSRVFELTSVDGEVPDCTSVEAPI